MLVGTGHAMYAREVRHRDARGGYRFEILGDLEADAQDLFKLLRERIRQGLSVRHVHETEHGWQLTQTHRLSGVIEWARDRRCAPASHRRWPNVHLGKEFDTLPADVRAKVRARLGRIHVRAQDVGWGFSDAVDEMLHALDARAAYVRPGKVDRRESRREARRFA